MWEAALWAIIAAVLLGILGWLVPIGFSLLQSRFAPGQNVTSKHWTTTYRKPDGTVRIETAELRQVLHWVRGKIHLPALKRTYTVHGRMTGNVLVATYEWDRGKGDDRTELDCGAFALLLKAGGVMEGCYSWMDKDTDKPASGEYVWRLVSNVIERAETDSAHLALPRTGEDRGAIK
jgi:hypothetical protein